MSKNNGELEPLADEPERVNRRTVLRATAGVAAGTAGLVAATGSASATIEALFEALQCGSEDQWLDAPNDYPVLDLRGETPERLGTWPADPDELTIFVHGLGADRNEQWKDTAFTFEVAAERAGFDRPQIAVLYDTAFDQLDWDAATAAADVAGRRLADWLVDFDGRNAVDAYRIVGHSLGTRVTGVALNELDGAVVVEDVALLGAAIPADSVCSRDGQFAPGIAAAADSVDSYRSWDDEVICDLYESSILGAGEDGLGCDGPECGFFGSPPRNFDDHHFPFSIDGHCDYPHPEDGIVDEIVANFDT